MTTKILNSKRMAGGVTIEYFKLYLGHTQKTLHPIIFIHFLLGNILTKSSLGRKALISPPRLKSFMKLIK